MPFTHDASLPADPATVLAALTDESFVRTALADLGADVRQVDIEGTTTTARYTVPTQGIPPVFARFVGDRVEVTDVRTWTEDGDGDGATGTVVVTTRLLGREVSLTGDRRIVPRQQGAEITSSGRSKVDAPMIGRQAEGAVDQLAVAVLRREAESLQRHLAP